MIFYKSLRRELSLTLSATFLVAVAIMLSLLLVRVSKQAIELNLDWRNAAIFLGLSTAGYLGVLLAAALFLSILIVLSRWYQDSEMIIWFASGVNLLQFIRPILQFSLPVALLIAILTLFIWPWTHQEIEIIKQELSQNNDLSVLAPGKFYKLSNKQQIIFIESLNKHSNKVENIFIINNNITNGKRTLVTARAGYLQTESNNNRELILENGFSYESTSRALDFNIMEFAKYKMQLPKYTEINRSQAELLPRAQSTSKLIENPNLENLGELLWRIGIPISAIILALLAIPLAYVNPRKGRYYCIAYAGIIYFIYSSLLNLMQALVIQNRWDFNIAWCFAHALVILLCSVLFYMRLNKLSL